MSFLVQRSDVGEFRRRYRWLVLFVLLLFSVLIGRLVQLQLIEGDAHRAQARKNIVRERYLATTRGVIRDALGRVLAANRPSYTVYITPSRLDMQATWPKLVRLVGLDESERQRLEKRIGEIKEAVAQRNPKERDRRADQQLVLKYDVDRDAVAWLETHEPQGVDVT
ncbi:MAG TPA: penicillin-binding protein 2, partial [Polyangiaceae bacterium]|nr:penicillin-binding protein 2 [Polyangiaceae bacterium]